MTKPTLTTCIPFAGFYNSIHESAFDWHIERELEYRSEEHDPECAELYVEYMQGAIDYSKAFELYAADYVELFNEYFEDATGIKLGLEFTSLDSPKEYNFTTDRIFCDIKVEVLEAIWIKVNQGDMERAVLDRFTSRSGFSSFYSNVLEFDHNQIETIIVALLDGAGCEFDQLPHVTDCNGEIDSYIDESISSDDWAVINELYEVMEDTNSIEDMEAVLQKHRDKRLPMKGEVATLKGVA